MDPGQRREGGQAGGGAHLSGDVVETELRTFLIADIRGYTTFTRERGDEAAGELAGRFAALVREVVAARNGVLLELRGDEALVVFVSARQALRAAIELQEQFTQAELPRGVGIGLDAGEAVPVEGGYRGSALNIAARLCGQAGPGQVIASEAVIHLAARVEGLAYVEPRSYRLKGLAEPIRAVDVVPAGRVPRGLRRTIRRARRILPFRRRSWIAGGAALVTLGVAAGLTIWLASGAGGEGADGAAAGSPSPSAAADPLADVTLPALAFLDAGSGEIVDTLAVPEVVEARFVDGFFWVLGLNPKAFYQIDPETRAVVTTITIPLVKEGWYAFGDGTLWYTDFGAPGRVIGIDLRTQLTVADFRVNEDPEDLGVAVGVAVGAGSLWVSKPEAGEILRLDPQTGEIQARIESFVPDILEFGDGALWVVGAGRIARVDPATNRLSFEPRELALNANLSEIEFGGGHAWTADDVQGLVWKIDSTGSVAGTYQAGAGARSLAYADGVIWVGNQDAGTVTGIDATTGGITTHEIGHGLSTVAANDGELLVGVWPRVEDYVAELEGEVLTIAVPFDPFFPAPDPPVNQSFEFRQVGHATCAGLLAYPDEPAPDGWELQPEVAEALPAVSDDGRTYTYTIREGFAFSPPSDQPVSAETYRYSIERALSAGLGGSSQFIGMRFLGDIVGAQAFHDGEAEHIEGIVADGNRLSITLEEPSGDLPARLALPYFCPVPTGTPVALDGLDTRTPLSAAGPYYVHVHFGGELLELRPNPNYEGPRPQSWDHIVFRLGIDLAEAVALVEAGEMDAVVGPSNRSPLRPLGDVANEWGPGSEAAQGGDQRWLGAPRFGLDFVAIDPTAELFSDPAVRQAVGLALDRRALAVAYAEAPAAGLLPPSVPGSLPVDAAIPERDVDAALELMDGRTGSAVMVAWGACSVCVEFANTVAGQLATIGIEVEVREVDDPLAALHEDDEASLVNGFLDTDFPDPGTLLESIRLLPWTPTEVLDELDRVQSSGGEERVAAAAALGTRLSDEDFLAIPAAYPVYPMYIAEDVGCAFVQPAIGAVDLVQLCRD